MKKTITKQELVQELKTLKKFGLTDEEIEGYLECYYKNKFLIVSSKRILNSKQRKCYVNK